MKKLLTLIAVFVGVSMLTVAIAGQSPLASYVANNILGYAAPMNLDAGGSLVANSDGTTTSLNITAPVVVKVGTGRIMRVFVNTAGSAPGGVYDVAASGSAAAGNLIAVLPNTVGVYNFAAPVTNGIDIATGTGQVVSAVYQ